MAELVGGDRGIVYAAVLVGCWVGSHQMLLVVVLVALALAWGVVCTQVDSKPWRSSCACGCGRSKMLREQKSVHQ